ncbi:NAD(P)-dependent dehydrogenase, short-chain alcohol dehydrogenase family [Tenacibaculum sp. MAR_2009_124]|uniref:SDR family oxidoreductase n=1 Tax=Tenacibaculum sp. MAR_2009_124 TaxID=1250059 RepID=UPI00089469D5|nr:SDR family oxidoreductase [Tenacibaculum sp. MAR_2009_124]SEC35528.1 NAD(P)-dependent dehydrogenase, short-chain alcohol dehydrogenase family [Tenacibaculum sp. MAR_2009_124]
MSTKTIVITGGTTGIGFSCAEYLLGLNYQVIITGKTKDNLDSAVSKLGNNSVGILSDTSSLNDIDNLVSQVKSRFGKIDGLFINAGIFKASNFEQTSEELFDQTMNINFKGAFFTIQKFIPILKNPSSVVLNTSIVVFKAFADTSVYTASKAALESLSKVLNIELADKGIRVNIVSPGVTESPIQKKSGMSDDAIDNLLKHFSSTSPIGRIIQPTDIAPIVEFLLSDKSQVLRNEKIIVDGGTTL